MNKVFLYVLISISFIIYILWFLLLSPVSRIKTSEVFIIPQDQSFFNITESLYQQKLIRNKKIFQFLINNFYIKTDFKSGGYNLKPSMNSIQILKKITSKQDLVWINIFACPRKEQVGEKLQSALGWDNNKLNEWNNLFKNTDYYEGVFYPDTYLIPVNESAEQIAKRFINRFNEKFEPLSSSYIQKNIKWTTGLKIASLIAREAAGREDAKLISGIIWNRLNQGMRLQIDATMQYTLGKNENGSWWGNISLEQKRSDSLYNSYRNEGLPPTPICSPNIDFIEAAVNPEETDCIFYLHDSNRQIHCAKTYEEHNKNINYYLR